MAFTITTRLKNDTGSSSTDRLTGDPTLTGVGAANQVVYFYEADRLIGTALADANGNWSYTPPLPDGKHSITVKQTNAGVTASALVSFVLDTAPPAVIASLKSGPVASFTPTPFTSLQPSLVVTGPTYNTTGDVNHDGAVDLVTLDEGSAVALVSFGDGKGGFSTAIAVPTGNAPSAVTVADVNGDGLGDLLVTNAADDTVSILSNDGLGGFIASTLAVGPNPQAVHAEDLSGDGNLDLLVATAGDNNVTLFTGNGKGQFVKSASYAVGLGPDSLSLGDVNGDGKADIVTANMADGTVSVLLGTGAGKFGPARTFDVGGLPIKAALKDVDGDGKLDLLVANSGDASVTVLHGDGAGGFQPLSVVHFIGSVTGMSVGDMNGDGFADLVAGGVIAYGDGTGHFVPGASAGGGPLADVNGDGKLDILRFGTVFINTTTGPRNGFIADPTLTGSGDARATVHFLEGGKEIGKTVATQTGSWSFRPTLLDGRHDITVQETDATGNVGSAHVIFTLDTVAPTPTAVLAHDNGTSAVDGRTNDATISGKGAAGNSVQLYEGTVLLGSTVVGTDGTWSVTPVLPDGVHRLFAKETDAAGNVGSSANVVFTLDQTAPNVSASLSPTTTLAFSAPVVSDAAISFPSFIGAADLNGDGKVDVVSASSGQIAVQFGDGTGKLGPAIVTYLTGNNGGGEYSLADANGDGKTDLLSSVGPANMVFINDGTGKFAAPVTVGPISAPGTYMTVDLNGDKKADLISFNGQISVQLGDGTGKFGVAVTSPGGMYFSGSPLIFDANADGQLDVATFGSGGSGPPLYTPSSGISVALNTGDGKFGSVSNIALGFSPTKLLAGDIDGDGKTDLIALGYRGGGYVATVVLGDGSGRFGRQIISTVASDALSNGMIADVNGDGKGDLIFASSFGGIFVALGDGTGGFGSAVSFGSGQLGNPFAIADLNGDGKADVIASSPGNGTSMDVLLNTTTGPFGNVVKLPVLRGTGEAGTTVSISEAGKLLGTTTTDASGAWTFTPTLSDGTHVLLVQQTDAAGNVGSRPITILVKGHVAAVTAVLSNDTGALPSDGLTTDPTIKGTGGIGETISLSEGTTLLGTTVADKNGVWSFKPVLSDGLHNLTVVDSDAAGNASAPATVSFTLDTLAPVVSIVPPATVFRLGAGSDYDSGLTGATNSVNSADIDGDGKLDVVVADNSSFTILKGNGTGAFSKLSTVSVGSPGSIFGSSVVLADVNGDGKSDVIYLSSGNFGTAASVFINTGNGTFRASTSISLNSQQVAAADLNGDGKADLVYQAAGALNVMLNDGTGKFAVAVSYGVAGGGPSAPLLVDLNGDGRADIVEIVSSATGITSIPSNGIFILMNDGTGKFSQGPTRIFSSSASNVLSADVNGDGNADIILIGATAGNNVATVLLGDGTGNFAPPIVTSLGATPSMVSVGDMNGDGRADLILHANDGSISLMTSDGSGKFSSAIVYGTVSGGGLTVADINADGKPDLLTTDGFNSLTNTNPLTVLLNTSTGAFGNMVNLPVLKGTAEAGATVSVFEGTKQLAVTTPGVKGSWSLTPVLTDGRHTLVVKQTDAAGNLGSSTLTLVVKTVASTLTASLANDTGQSATDGLTGDATLTGKGGAGDTISVYEGATVVATVTAGLSGAWTIRPVLADGAHTLTIKDTDAVGNVSIPVTVKFTLDASAPTLSLNPLTTLGFAAPVSTVVTNTFSDWFGTADLDGDGKTDIVTSAGGIVTIAAGTGTATPGAVRTFAESGGTSGSGPMQNFLADMNGDGKPDLVGVYSGALTASVITYLNNGKGSFGTGITAALPTGSGSILAADLNGDGKADLVNFSNGQAYVLTNAGAGTFNGFTKYSLGAGNLPGEALLADLNGDNRPDIIAFGQSVPGIVTLLNDGTGHFLAAAPLIPTAVGLAQVFAVDVNGDGKIDLVGVARGMADQNSTIITMLGDGTGKFTASATNIITQVPNFVVAITDLNGDNRPDLLLSPDANGNLAVRLGDGAGGFGPETTYAAGTAVTRVVATDINGDGKRDIAVLSSNPSNGIQGVGVLLNTTTGPFGYTVASPTLTGKGDPGLAVSVVEGTTLLGSVIPGATGNWSFKPALTSGAHTLTVKQTDIAGNTSSASMTVTVPATPAAPPVVVTSAPVIVKSAPAIHIGGGTVVLDPALTGVTVKLDAATNLTLNKMGFITVIGSTGADTIAAQAINQTLTGGAGADILAGFSGFGTTFSDSSSGLNGDQIKLFGGNDVIDLTDIAAGAAKPLTYKGTVISGVLTASDGVRTANINFAGNYSVANFKLASDGAGGSMISFVRP